MWATICYHRGSMRSFVLDGKQVKLIKINVCSFSSKQHSGGAVRARCLLRSKGFVVLVALRMDGNPLTCRTSQWTCVVASVSVYGLGQFGANARGPVAVVYTRTEFLGNTCCRNYVLPHTVCIYCFVQRASCFIAFWRFLCSAG